MPTFKICVFEHHRRKDGKYRVSVRLGHNRQYAYIKTDTYVVRKQITNDFSGLKDTETIRSIDRDIIEYEKLLLRGLGSNLSRYTAKELVSYIEQHIATDGGTSIDFIAFAREYSSMLKDAGRGGYAERFDRVIRAIIDYFGRDKIYINEINSGTLRKIEEYLLKPRTMVRINQLGKEYTITRPGLKTQSVVDFMRLVHILFNAARNKYNDEDDEDLDIITHNPFRKYKPAKVTEEPAKRSLPIDELLKIINYADGNGRTGMARDIFLLSFYLIGMNTADIYREDATIANGRITYRRSKTKARRKDQALISIKIEPEVEALVKKYRDPSKKRAFLFYHNYTTARGFNQSVDKGLKQLAREIGINPKLSSYYARHTWATIAANNCELSDSDIALALNHVGIDEGGKNHSLKVTRGYITRDWSKLDKMNRKVLDYVYSCMKK